MRPDQRPAVHEGDEQYVMTFPHLIVREIILFQLVVIGLSLAAIFFDAPLESIANPVETPNPAKAPWYFLGLQELLHYFPPIVAGVLLPALVVIGLLVIPYARINLEAGPLWTTQSRRKLAAIAAAILLLTILFGVFELLARGDSDGDHRRAAVRGQARAAAVAVGSHTSRMDHDLVRRDRYDSHGDRDVLSRSRLVVGLAVD